MLNPYTESNESSVRDAQATGTTKTNFRSIQRILLFICTLLVVVLGFNAIATSDLFYENILKSNYVNKVAGLVVKVHTDPTDPPQNTSLITRIIKTPSPTVSQEQNKAEKPKKSIVAICSCLKSRNGEQVQTSTLQSILIQSIEKTISAKERDTYDIRLYLGVDHNDEFWLRHAHCLTVPDWLRVTFVFAEKQPHKVPFNAVTLQAYKDGAEYINRVNDDTEYVTSGWMTLGIRALAEYNPPNVGVVGPRSLGDSQKTMTHDMTHRTHVDIFGFYYPPVFSAWWVDDWITDVYKPSRSRKLQIWNVKHQSYKYGTRYAVQHHEKARFPVELENGKKLLQAYLANPKSASTIPIKIVKTERIDSSDSGALAEKCPYSSENRNVSSSL